MTDLKLPELPVSPHVIGGCTGPEPGDWRTWTAYTEAHMHAYATAAVLAERERVRAEVRRNDDGTLDEVVGFGTFHLEQMDAGHWWMQLGPHAVHLQAHRVIKAIINENEHDDDAR